MLEPFLWSIGYGWLVGAFCFTAYLFSRFAQLDDVRNKWYRPAILIMVPVTGAGLIALGWVVYLCGGFGNAGMAIAALVAFCAVLFLSLRSLQIGIARENHDKAAIASRVES